MSPLETVQRETGSGLKHVQASTGDIEEDVISNTSMRVAMRHGGFRVHCRIEESIRNIKYLISHRSYVVNIVNSRNVK